MTVYKWYGKDGNEVSKALNKLFGRSGADLETGVDGQLTFIQNKKSKARIQPDPTIKK